MSDAIGFSDGGHGARPLALVTRTLSAEGIGFSCMVKASSMSEKEHSITQRWQGVRRRRRRQRWQCMYKAQRREGERKRRAKWVPFKDLSEVERFTAASTAPKRVSIKGASVCVQAGRQASE